MTGAPDTTPFEPSAPVEPGVTVLEASAGTGKTHAITAIATRLVADGIPLSELLLVTFTRMATGELRDRVRGYLVRAEAALTQALAGHERPIGDKVVDQLATGDRATLERRRMLLARALTEFDAATITTTHGFCVDVLAQLGIGGDVDRQAGFVEDVSDLVEEAVSDLYVRRFAPRMQHPPFSLADALGIARTVVSAPHAAVVPADSPAHVDGPVWEMRGRLAHAVRREVEARKRRLGVMTYDDLLTRVRDRLTHGEVGEAACRQLRTRYRYVLVDEFQDTDPIQWEIFRRAFASEETSLILIGDPKQAIYAFRGADVYAYLDAVRTAGERRTLDTNWRSDENLLDALNGLFAGIRLGHPDITCREIHAARPTNRAPESHPPFEGAPLRIRLLRADAGLAALNRFGRPVPSSAEDAVAHDLAAETAALIAPRGDAEGSHPPDPQLPGAVLPRDVAVLVRTNRQARLVRQTLLGIGVPAVEYGAGSVFASSAAESWLRLLEALERPSATGRAHAAALTPFLGWNAERLATAHDEALEQLHTKLHQWSARLTSRGVAVLYRGIAVDEDLPRRLLSQEDGARRLTDLMHVSQLLHEEAMRSGSAAASLAGWLRSRIADADDDAEETRVRRLDSDAEAVQVLTVHRCKGLEFPIVLVPFGWQAGYVDSSQPPRFHEDGVWKIDVGGEGSPGIGLHRARNLQEHRAEDLRLLYVALTRAKHQVVVWWAGAQSSGCSPLARILLGRQPDGTIAPEDVPVPSDDQFEARVQQLADERPDCVAVERVVDRARREIAHPGAAEPELVARTLGRWLDLSWTRSSFTRVVAGEWERRVSTERDDELRDDEPAEGAVTPESNDTGEPDGARLPLGGMPGGAQVGDLIHRVLQATDFTAPDLDIELVDRITEQRRRRDVAVGESQALADGLRSALQTPLGPLVGGLSLSQVHRNDRLDELPFELPLVGGDRPAGTLNPTDIARLLADNLDDGDPLAGYAARLHAAGLRVALRGYLTGIIDLVLRTHEDTEQRFFVVDYKTNMLAPPGVALRPWHYRPAALIEAMQEAHYPLQALFYVVALHRYLRWRIPGYAPERQLGGVLYLFLRGMDGDATPSGNDAPCGVFAWQPPLALIEKLSDAFDRGATQS